MRSCVRISDGQSTDDEEKKQLRKVSLMILCCWIIAPQSEESQRDMNSEDSKDSKDSKESDSSLPNSGKN